MTGAHVLLTISDVAARLAVSEDTVRRRIAAGAMAVVRDGRMIRVSVAALEDYIARRTVPARGVVPKRRAQSRAPGARGTARSAESPMATLRRVMAERAA